MLYLIKNGIMRNMLILLSLVTIIFSSCGPQKDEDKIIGKWKIIDFEANTTAFPQVVLDEAKVEVFSRTYSFREDQTFTIKSNLIANGEQGIWELTNENKSIKMKYPPGSRQSQEVYLIDIMSSNSMKWTQDFKERGSVSMVLEKE